MCKPYTAYRSMYKNYTVASCTCKRPEHVVRFGEAILCLDKRCLSGWVFVTAKKMTCTWIGIRRISRAGPALWYDFLDHLVAYFWQRVAQGNANGLSVYDVDAGMRSFAIRHKNLYVEEPSLEVTQPSDYGDQEVEGDAPHSLSDLTLHLVAVPTDPSKGAFLARLERQIVDPLLALYWADELTTAEACMLAGTTAKAWIAYADQAMQEVRNGG